MSSNIKVGKSALKVAIDLALTVSGLKAESIVKPESSEQLDAVSKKATATANAKVFYYYGGRRFGSKKAEQYYPDVIFGILIFSKHKELEDDNPNFKYDIEELVELVTLQLHRAGFELEGDEISPLAKDNFYLAYIQCSKKFHYPHS